MYPPFTAAAAAAKSLQSCPTLCDPIDGSPTGSPVPGILKARTLDWVAASGFGAIEEGLISRGDRTAGFLSISYSIVFLPGK